MSKGAYLYTIRHEGDGANFFASKAFVNGGESETVWSNSESPTDANIKTVLRRIETEILSNHETKEIELADFFLKVRNREVSYEEFENFMLKNYENNPLKRAKTQENKGV